MKKKAFAITFCLLLSISVFFCSCKKKLDIPKGMSEEVYDLGVRALSLMDDFHNGKISSKDVEAPLNSIYARLEIIQRNEKDIDKSDSTALRTTIMH